MRLNSVVFIFYTHQYPISGDVLFAGQMPILVLCYRNNREKNGMNSSNNLRSHWMPFTNNRAFKKNPKLFASASGVYYETPHGRKILDGTSGLWCCNAGHGRPRIVEAIQKAAATLDYAPGFQLGHPASFKAAEKILDIAPDAFSHIFFYQFRF